MCLLCPRRVPQCPRRCETSTFLKVLDCGAPAFVDMSVDDSDQERPAMLTGNRFEVLSDTAERS